MSAVLKPASPAGRTLPIAASALLWIGWRMIRAAGGDVVLVVATDRVSAYDHVLSPGIPGKGVVLTQLSLWWFEQLADLVPHHVVSTDVPGAVAGRAMVWVTRPSPPRWPTAGLRASPRSTDR